MKADIFFANSIDVNNRYRYDDKFIQYFIIKKIYEYGKPMTVSDLADLIENIYSCNINRTKTYKYFSSFLYCEDDEFDITTSQVKRLNKTNEFKDVLFQLEREKEEEIYKILNERFLSFREFDAVNAVIYLMTLQKIANRDCTDKALSEYYDFITNYNKYYSITDNTLDRIDCIYYSLPINQLFKNEIIKKVLFSNGINTIADLINHSVTFALTVLSIDFQASIDSLKSLDSWVENELSTKLSEIFNSLKENQLETLSLRNGFETEEMTLEEIGSKSGLTRQRIEQIEKSAEEKVIEKSNSIQNQIHALFYNLAIIEKRYITIEQLNSYFDSSLITNYYLFVISVSDSILKYDKKLKIVYNSAICSIEELRDEVINVYGDFLSLQDYQDLNQFEKNIVNICYKLINNSVYVHKSYGSKQLIGVVIDDNFPEGYHIGSNKDYQLLKNRYQERFGFNEKFPSERSIVGFIERLGYCQIDRGTYKNPANCVTLPKELVDKMINYILINSPTIFYSSIFSKFESELKELGVNNYYYLKGLIDPLLPSDFKAKRNFISTSNNVVSTTDTIVSFMKSFNGKFTMTDLENKFEGVKDYTFYNALYNEIENGLVWTSGKSFVYLDKLYISQDTIDEFKQFIDKLFASLSAAAISSRKIYAKLCLTNKDLLNRLKIANDNFSTFSLARTLFSNDYGFNRPIISKDKSQHADSYSMIVNYVLSLESFNHKTINTYVAKMNIRNLYSYLAFMEDMSDDFVQINIETMIKKNKLNLNEDILKEIDYLLTLILERFGKLDTRQFNGYQMFPKIEYNWNQYLLAGIVRTFLSNKYTVESTSNFFNDTYFIIGGIHNGK